MYRCTYYKYNSSTAIILVKRRCCIYTWLNNKDLAAYLRTIHLLGYKDTPTISSLAPAWYRQGAYKI